MNKRSGKICFGIISLVTILTIPFVFLPPANAEYTFTDIVFPGATGTQTAPQAINDIGQIVGGYGNQGFIFNGSAYSTFNAPSYNNALLTGINNSGEIVGIYNPGAPSSNSAFLLINNTFTPITMAGAGIIGAYGINNLGQVVGSFSAGYGYPEQGFIYSGGNFTYTTPPGLQIAFRGINDNGQICGEEAGLNAAWTGFLYSGGAFTYFNVPNAYSTAPLGINNLGQIVGYYQDSTGGQHGFLRNSDGTFITTAWPGATELDGINNLGQIVGYASNTGGFLATPVPVPPSLFLLAPGLLGLMVVRRRFRK